MLTKFQSIARAVVPVHLDGNVSIDPSAAIAPGVLLQAEADSRITIGAGVCIGAGSIVHASGGEIEIGMGVCIGRGVLIIGSGTIDRNACIGAGTTAINPQIAEGETIATHSLLGDRSRGEVSVVESPHSTPTPSAPTGANDVWATEDIWDPPAQTPVSADPNRKTPDPPDTKISVEIEVADRATKSVAGRANFDRLKRHLFPNG